jgi:hypothetical protein
VTSDGHPPLTAIRCPVFEDVRDRHALLATRAEAFDRPIPNGLARLKGANFSESNLRIPHRGHG